MQPKSTQKERVVYRDGMLKLEDWQRSVAALLAMIGSLFGAGCSKLDEVVVDVVNVWRSKVAKAVTCALLKHKKKVLAWAKKTDGDALAEEAKGFVDDAAQGLAGRIKYFALFLRAVRADRLLLVFDGHKEMLSLLRKGHVANTAADVVLAPHDVGNMLNLMNKWTDGMKGWATSGKGAPAAQLQQIHNLVAGALHSSECGRQLTRLIVMTAIRIVLQPDADGHIKFEGGRDAGGR